MSKEQIQTILDFWFEGIDDSTVINLDNLPFKKWFIPDNNVDEIIREQFESDLNKAIDGKLKDWEKTPNGRLALIILFDQFSRNMYRDTPRMYTTDSLALALTQRVMSEGMDQEYLLIHRAFLYLPLMHSEDVNLQQQSVQSFTQLVGECKTKNPKNTFYYEYSLKHAKEHYDTVAKFGRFVHRDEILKRGVHS